MLDIDENILLDLSWAHLLTRINRCLLHDFSNQIAGILALSELYCSYPQSDSIKEGLLSIKNNGLKGRDLLHVLSQLNRPSYQDTYIDLYKFLKDLEPVFLSILPSNINFKLNMPQELIVKSSTFYLLQIFFQLLYNASDALKTHTKPQLTIDCSIHNQNILCIIQYNGCGYYPHDPIQASFKKKDAEHLGLGLYSVQKCLERIQGQLSFTQTTPGTCIQLTFPRAS